MRGRNGFLLRVDVPEEHLPEPILSNGTMEDILAVGENHEAALAIRAQEEAALMASVEAEAAADMEILAAVRRKNCSPQSVDKLSPWYSECSARESVMTSCVGRGRRLRTRGLQRRRHQLPLRSAATHQSRKPRRRSAARLNACWLRRKPR